jgi:uncharacterized protein (TIGR02265 family)
LSGPSRPATCPPLADTYRSLGLDLGRPLLPAYEYRIWRACLVAQREAVFPGVAVAEASFRQGVRYMDAYFERTVIGGAMLLALRAIGVRRALERMSRNFRSGNNFGEATFTSTGATSGTLWVNDVFSDSADYVRGMVTRGMQLVGAANANMETQSHDGDAATFAVTWGQG